MLPVDPVGELAEGSRVAWGWLVDARGVGVELQLTGPGDVDVFTWVVVPLALRAELAWDWLVDTRGAGTELTDGCSVEEITTEVAAAACLVVSGVRPPLGVIWRGGEKPEKAIGSLGGGTWFLNQLVAPQLLRYQCAGFTYRCRSLGWNRLSPLWSLLAVRCLDFPLPPWWLLLAVRCHDFPLSLLAAWSSRRWTTPLG